MAASRIAVLVIAHANPRTFERLVAALEHPCIEVFVHIDARADLALFQTAARRGVTFIPARTANFWASWTQVEIALRLLRAAKAAGPFASYALVSGDSLPLLLPEALVAALLRNPTALQFSTTRPGSRQFRRVTGIYLPHTRFGRLRDKLDFMDRGLDPKDFDDIIAAMGTLSGSCASCWRMALRLML